MYSITDDAVRHSYPDLRTLLAKASTPKSGDALAQIGSKTAKERAIAQMALADVPLADFLEDLVIPYDKDAVTRLIIDTHDATAFEPVSSLTVGEFRDWLLSEQTTGEMLTALSPGIIPEMAAAVSKLMRIQDLVHVSSKIRVVTKFRTTLGQPGTLAARLQPNHPTDDPMGIVASAFDGLMYGSGDACIGINPATDSVESSTRLLMLLDQLRQEYGIPTQSCVLTHITNTIKAIENGAPVDLVFQSIGGTEGVNTSFGVTLDILQEGYEAGLSLGRGTVGDNLMYFETGQGSALSANAHHDVDQQTLEARAYGVARHYKPFLLNSVVGFIGPEYLYDEKQIIRAGLEDHFCGKLLGIPMGVDVCYTNHADADQDSMDTLLTMLGVAGVNFIIGVPGADDIMLNYQSNSFHDALYIRRQLGCSPAPEFAEWLEKTGIFKKGHLQNIDALALPEKEHFSAISK